MSGWYVIQTKQLKEDLASINLKKQNFSVYFPLIESWEIKRFCKKNSKKPLFPSYIFVFIPSIKESWKKITYTRGVRKIITIGYLHSLLAPLPCDFVYRSGAPDFLLVHGESLIKILETSLNWPKNKLRLIQSLRFRVNDNRDLSKKIFLPNIISNKNI